MTRCGASTHARRQASKHAQRLVISPAAHTCLFGNVVTRSGCCVRSQITGDFLDEYGWLRLYRNIIDLDKYELAMLTQSDELHANTADIRNRLGEKKDAVQASIDSLKSLTTAERMEIAGLDVRIIIVLHRSSPGVACQLRGSCCSVLFVGLCELDTDGATIAVRAWAGGRWLRRDDSPAPRARMVRGDAARCRGHSRVEGGQTTGSHPVAQPSVPHQPAESEWRLTGAPRWPCR